VGAGHHLAAAGTDDEADAGRGETVLVLFSGRTTCTLLGLLPRVYSRGARRTRCRHIGNRLVRRDGRTNRDADVRVFITRTFLHGVAFLSRRYGFLT